MNIRDENQTQPKTQTQRPNQTKPKKENKRTLQSDVNAMKHSKDQERKKTPL